MKTHGDQSRRFWAKVKKTRKCWDWTGAVTHDGYGKFKIGGHQVCASRFACEQEKGPFDLGLVVRHRCGNSLCVNPAHLEPVTPRVHTLTGRGPTNVNALKRFCMRGHPLSGDNLYVTRDHRRKCRACQRLAQQKRKERFQGKRRPKPGKVKLKAQMRQMNFTELGEYYGVSDTAVRKWARGYNLR